MIDIQLPAWINDDRRSFDLHYGLLLFLGERYEDRELCNEDPIRYWGTTGSKKASYLVLKIMKGMSPVGEGRRWELCRPCRQEGYIKNAAVRLGRWEMGGKNWRNRKGD